MPHSRAHIRSNRHASSDLYANNHSHEHGHGNPRANRHTNDDGNPGFIQGYRCAARDRNSTRANSNTPTCRTPTAAA